MEQIGERKRLNVTQQIQLQPTVADYQALLNGNPLAAAELKAIVLARLLAEKEAKLAALKEPESVADITDEAAD